MMSNDPLLRMKDITKRFPGIVANNRVTLEVRAGEIHALLGENGAGKTTLMNVLYGLYQAEEGQIFIRGEETRVTSPGQAMELGIGMVHQHFMLVPVLTVAENIVLGLPPGRGPWLDLAGAEGSIRALSEKSGLYVDPGAKVWQLPVGVQQRVEILKFLYRGVDILILDEPTAVLTPDEVSRFFKVLEALKSQGVTIILITHKLKEVMAASDRVTVMRNGSAVATMTTSSTNPKELARLMVGRDVVFRVTKQRRPPGPPVLEVENLHVQDDRDLPALRGPSLSVRQGEILGIAGVSGNGQSELAQAICGVRPVKAGSIAVAGNEITSLSVSQIIQAGVAHIPADRQAAGSIADFTLAENTVLSIIDTPPFSRRGILDWATIRGYGEHLLRDFDVKSSGVESLSKWLSGGNLQKLVLARELARSPRLLIAEQPTRGLDVAAIEYVHNRLLQERERGAAILLISTDLDEIMTLSDRIAVIYEGQIVGIVRQEEADIHEIALLMTGGQRQSVGP
jgi:simple sugar transport system ATP-binding protein